MLAYLNEKIYLDRRVHCCFICVLSQQMASPGPSVTSGRTRASSVGILFALPCPCLSEQPAFPEPWHVNNGLDLTATHLETPFPAPPLSSYNSSLFLTHLTWPDHSQNTTGTRSSAVIKPPVGAFHSSVTITDGVKPWCLRHLERSGYLREAETKVWIW